MANHGTKIDHIPPQSQIAKMPTQNLIKLIELIFFLINTMSARETIEKIFHLLRYK